MTETFRIESLNASHDRKSFSCEVPALDRYLRELASQDMRRRVSNCFVAIDATGTIAGYYTLAACNFPLSDLNPDDAKRLPRYSLLPAALIGRLAVDRRFRGKRLGSALVMDAARRSARADLATFALVVDAKDDAAIGFYQHLGFKRFASRTMSLFLPIATMIDSLSVVGR